MEKDGPTEKDVEKADRPLWLMLLPAVVLICVALLLPYAPGRLFDDTALFMHPNDSSILGTGLGAQRLLDAPLTTGTMYYSWIAVGAAVAIAALSLSRVRLLAFLTPVFRLLQSLHCANVGDYAAWQCIGLSAFVLAYAYL